MANINDLVDYLQDRSSDEEFDNLMDILDDYFAGDPARGCFMMSVYISYILRSMYNTEGMSETAELLRNVIYTQLEDKTVKAQLPSPEYIADEFDI